MLSCPAPALTVVEHLDQQHHRHLAPHPGHLLGLTRGYTPCLPGLDPGYTLQRTLPTPLLKSILFTIHLKVIDLL